MESATWRRYGLRGTFAACTLAVAVLVAAASSVGLGWTRDALIDQVEQAERMLAEERADQLASSLDQMHARLETLAGQPLFAQALEDDDLGRLRAFFAASANLPGVVSYAIRDLAGNELLRVPDDASWPAGAGRDPTPAVIPTSDRRDAVVRYVVDTRGSDGTLRGGLEQLVSVQELLPTWASRPAETGGRVILVRTDGEVLISAAADAEPEHRLADPVILDAVGSGRAGVVTYETAAGTRHIAAVTPVGRADLVVVAGQPQSAAFAAARSLTLRVIGLLAACLVALAVLLVAAVRTVQRMRARIEDERRVAEELARTDALTGLANRRALDDAVARLQVTGESVAIAAVDVDGLKGLNDRLGHGAGDAALRRVADALRSSARPRDVVARIGGDEFVVVWRDTALEREADLEQRLRGALADHGASASIGVAAGEPADFIELLATADERCYADKRIRKEQGIDV